MNLAEIRIAVVDPASFVLPYDFYFIRSLLTQGIEIDFYYSRTIANLSLVDNFKHDNLVLHAFDVSSTVAPRSKGLLNYLRMCWQLFLSRKKYAAIIWQFPILPIFDLCVFGTLGRKLWLTVHEDTGAAGRKSPSTMLRLLWNISGKLIFVSGAVKAKFLTARPHLAGRSLLAQLGAMPVIPEDDHLDIPVTGFPERTLVFWGLVKPYKGVEFLGEVSKYQFSKEFRIEIHGKWHKSLRAVRTYLAGLGIQIRDEFLDNDELRRLLSRPVLFVLPYHSSTQSAVLYTLLHYGCVFVATDVGDLGAFLRKHGMQQLLFNMGDLKSFENAVSYAYSNFKELRTRMLAIRAQYSWIHSAHAIHKALLADQS